MSGISKRVALSMKTKLKALERLKKKANHTYKIMDVELGVGEPTVKESEGAGILKIQKDAAFRLFHQDLGVLAPFYRIPNQKFWTVCRG